MASTIRGFSMRRIGEDSAEASRIMLGLLDAVEQDRAQSQRHLASELGIALGLVNAYLKRCIKKGLVKVRHAPARRYAYYLTPQGFAEKSRLTVEYLSYSFAFFRQAKADCSELFRTAKARGVSRIVLLGQSDLAEIAALCAMEQAIGIVGLVQKSAIQSQFIGLPVFEDFEAVPTPFDCVLITDVSNARAACALAVAHYGIEHVLVPELLRVRIGQQSGVVE
jgi:DNA-binding MarR family transcriptional regulator